MEKDNSQKNKKPELGEITWQSRDYIDHPKKTGWYIVITILAAALIIYFIYEKDLLAAVLFFLIYILVIAFSRQKPKKIQATLSGNGIQYGDINIPYKELKSFWIIYDPPEIKTLNLETTAFLNKYLTIQLENQDPVEVRFFLLNFLPEDLEKEEGFAEKVSRKAKF